MRFRLFDSRAFALAAMMLVAPTLASIAKAQEVAVVSIANLERTLGDVSYLLRASSVPEVGGLVSIMSMQYTQGIDQKRPIGATVKMENGMPNAVVFMPMTDTEQFFGALAGMGVEPDDLGDGLYEIDAGGQIIYAKDANGWMFIGQTEESVADTPANPAALLGKLPETYDLAVKLNLSNLPQEMKDMALEQIKFGFEQSMAMQPGLTEEQIEANQKAGEASIKQMEMAFNDTEQIIIGWAISEDEQRTFIDGGFRFVEGSQFASQANAAANVTSAYTKFVLPGASAMFRASSIIDEADREMAVASFKNSLNQATAQMDQADMPPEARELVDELLDGITNLMVQTIEDGEFDGAGSVSVAEGALQVLVGGKIGDGEALAKLVKETVAKLPPGAPLDFNFDYETYKGITLHSVSGPPIPDPKAVAALGETPKIIIGTGPKSFFINLDPTGDATVKKVIDAMSDSQDVKVTPFEGSVALGAFLKFAHSIEPDPILGDLIQTIGEYSDNDKISISSRLIKNGFLYRFSIDEGILQTVGSAAKSGAAMGGGF